MSTTLTLQADLVIPARKELAFSFTIPSGTVVTFTDAPDIDAVGEQLRAISPAALGANLSQLNRTLSAPSGISGFSTSEDVYVKHGPQGDITYLGFSASMSPSASTSASPSASSSASPSAS